MYINRSLTLAFVTAIITCFCCEAVSAQDESWAQQEPCLYGQSEDSSFLTFECSSKLNPFKDLVGKGHPALDRLFAKSCPTGCGFSDKAEFYSALGDISRLSFSSRGERNNCIYSYDVCAKFDSWTTVYRSIDVSIGELVSNIQNRLRSLSYGGCDYMNVYVGSPILSGTSMTFNGGWDGKTRFYCDDLLGTATKFSFSGKFTITLRLAVTEGAPPFAVGVENPLTEGVVKFSMSHATYDEETKFLTIFDTKTFVGNLARRLLTLPFDLTTRLFSDNATASDKLRLLEDLSSEVDASGIATMIAEEGSRVEMFAAKSKGVIVFDKYFPFRVLVDGTGFVDDKSGELIFRVNYAKDLPSSFGDVDPVAIFRDAVANALKLINSLGDQEISYTIDAGDRLESISLDKLGSRDLTFYLGFINSISDVDTIVVGQQLRIPPLWRVSMDIEDRALITPGDSFYSRLVGLGLTAEEAMTAIDKRQLSDFVLPFSESIVAHQD